MQTEEALRSCIKEAARTLRDTKALAGSITNAVTIDFVANAQLAAGGSAAMVYLPDEAQDLVRMGAAVYVNMGTLLPIHEQSCVAAARTAYEANKTCVLDPVGIGIGSLRSSILRELKQWRPRLVRGNASEIIALAKLWELELPDESVGQGPHGVDTTTSVDAARLAARALARYTEGAVLVSGEEDLATDGTRVVRIAGGSPLMGCVTGFGCSLGGVCAVYATVSDPFTAALAASTHFKWAGTQAAARADAPASFKLAFIDELYRARPEDIAQNPLYVE